MEGMKTLTCCTGLFIPRISSVSSEQSQSGVESSLEQILERQIRADLKVLEKHLRNSDQAGRTQVFGSFSETTASFGKPNVSELGKFRIDPVNE